jgi:hypothetical protein
LLPVLIVLTQSRDAAMAGSNDEPKEEIPAFKVSAKRVDDSWKEEVRKEREAAAERVAAQQKAAALAESAKGAPSVAPKGTATFDQPAAAEGKPADAASGPDATPAAPKVDSSSIKAMSPQEQQQTKIFLSFLENMAQQMLMQMGEMENPYSGQAELDIQGAQYTLALLTTMQAKTKGNLNEVENKAMTGILNDLKTHFANLVQELQRQQVTAQAAQLAKSGALKPGPGGTIR